MSRAVKRVFYYKRFAFFVSAVCMIVSMAIIFMSLEGGVKLSYKRFSYNYVLTSLTKHDNKDSADYERNTQLLMGNPSIVIEYSNSFFVAFEAYSSYNLAANALKTHKDNGRLLSILYIEFDKLEVRLKTDAVKGFKELYAFCTLTLDRTERGIVELEKKRMTSSVCELVIRSIESDFLKTALKKDITDDESLIKLQNILEQLAYELQADLSFKAFDERRQLQYLRLIFSVRFIILINENFS